MDDEPVQPVASGTETAMPSGLDKADRRVPLWARIVVFVAVIVVASGLTAVVIGRDHDRRSPEEAGGTSVSTASVPPPRPLITGATTGTTAPPRAPVAPPDENFVATELERVVARDSGWTHAITCWPAGPVRRDSVLQCDAHTEPPIDFVPPSTVIVTVLDDEGRFIWARGRTGHVTLDGLRSAPDLDCPLLRAHEYPYAAAVAYWVLRDRPAFIDVDASGRPCVESYGQATVDEVFDAALPYVPGETGVP